ncbi:hypothetical protein [Actinomycetospora sp. TBRC 11914]|uniref:hypothetical protein n=1 Tax=Actinomycetospora sp. TBRC 11914 TaxID=2729387 RepID=UPI001B7D6AFA|nr:hypothetical protein [Actinomycetospora sp. TBRC 11914]
MAGRQWLRADPVLASLWVGLAVIVVIFAIGVRLDTDSTTDEVCAAPTAVRVPDTDCTAHHPGDTWVYYRTGTAIPAVGAPTAGASADPPAGAAEPGVPDAGT